MAETIKKPSGELGLGNVTDSLNSILNLEPQVVFLDVRHQDYCPSIASQEENDCTCTTTKTTVISQDAWLKRFGQGRKERRASIISLYEKVIKFHEKQTKNFFQNLLKSIWLNNKPINTPHNPINLQFSY